MNSPVRPPTLSDLPHVRRIRRLLSSLAVNLVLAAGVPNMTPVLAADSPEELLTRAERTLANSGSFAVNYVVQGADHPDWAGVMLAGKLMAQGNNRCFMTNAGEISIIPAALTLVSDDKSHLLIHARGVEWIPERPGPLNVKQIARFLPRGGIAPMVFWVVADISRMYDFVPSFTGPLPALSSVELKTTGVQDSGIEQLPSGAAHHIRFHFAMGTNHTQQVDLWLDERSGLPVKRVFRWLESGDLMTETYSFTLNPTLPSDFFDPRRIARERKVAAQLIAAETPAARLLRGTLCGDENSVRLALEAGADANARTPPLVGRPGPQLSALMLASRSGNLAIVQRLVKAGAEVNAPAPSGATALDFAHIFHNPEVVAWLRSHGAKEGRRRP